jgi:hypothetical protein
MIFQRPLLLSINKNGVQRRKHPARNDTASLYPLRMRPWRCLGAGDKLSYQVSYWGHLGTLQEMERPVR